jgi:hypothetical protein
MGQIVNILGFEGRPHGSKPAQANSLRDPISKKKKKKTSQKRTGCLAQGVGPELKSQHHKDKQTKHT